jgi:hypothetical protein
VTPRASDFSAACNGETETKARERTLRAPDDDANLATFHREK